MYEKNPLRRKLGFWIVAELNFPDINDERVMQTWGPPECQWANLLGSHDFPWLELEQKLIAQEAATTASKATATAID
jgi:hypothetical protein